MKWYFILLIAVGAVGVIMFVGLCLYLARFVARPHHQSLADVRQRDEGVAAFKPLWQQYDRSAKKSYLIASYDGCQLQAEFIPAVTTSKHYVIISHGYSANRMGSVKYAMMFVSLGYNAVIYDNRGHGSNRNEPTTMGLKESRDLIAVIEDTRKRCGFDIIIGLHGESMGSGLQIMALKYHPAVRFIVNDCGYADLVNVLQGGLRSIFKLPVWLVGPASLLCRLMYGYRFEQCRPIDQLKDNQIPICFIHGQDDDFITSDNSVRMQKETAGYSQLHLIPKAAHAQSVYVDYPGYCAIVKAFTDRVDPRQD